MSKINVVKPFTYYINGYQRQDFTIGEYEVSSDCAAYATQYGFAGVEKKKKEKEEKQGEHKEEVKNAGTDKPARSKEASAS